MDVAEYLELKLFHEVHTSEIKSFRACRRRWNWVFRENYYPKITAKPLEFGTAFHKAMETYYDPTTWNDDRVQIGSEAILDFIDTCTSQKEKAIENRGSQVLEVDEEEDYAERVELGKGMLNYYFNDVAPLIDKGWKPVSVEQSFAVPVKHPITGAEAIWCTCDSCWNKYYSWLQTSPREVNEFIRTNWIGLPVAYEGRIDMLAQDEHGFYWVYDWKTARSISERQVFLYLDDQVGGYVWAMNKLNINVKGFVYHEQRKDYPQPPKRNKTIRMGRAFSVSKSEPIEYDSYLATVASEDTAAYESGLYDEFLTYLKEEGVVFWARHKIAKSPGELEEIERNIGLIALDMLQKDLLLYPSPGRFGCDFCAFQTPCIEKNAQSDYQYALDTMYDKKQHYYIREESSTESKGGI